MESKKRLQDSLNHKQPDKIPIDFDGTAVTGMHVSCVAALRDFYGLEKRLVKVHEPYQMLGLIDDDLKEVIGVDTIQVGSRNTMFGFPNENWKEWRLDSGVEVLVAKNFNISQDEKENKYIYPCGDMSVAPSGRMPKGGFYFDSIIRQEELDEDNLNPEDNMEEFQPISDEDLLYFKTSIENAALKGKGIIANFGGTALGDVALVPAPFLKHPKGIRDVEEWYVSTAIRRDYLHTVFEKQTDIALENLKKLNHTVGNMVDVVFMCGTDFGTQNSTFCSIDSFRELYMPYYKKLNSWIHSNTNWKTFKHSCGSIITLIDLFSEAGFDIINPVQCSAAGMEPELLKDRFGDKVTFWGGAVDTQRVLPFGTPQEVREQVLRRCEIFSRNGGFVFNSIHNVQANTPIENIVAMIEAVREFNGR